MRSCAPCAPQHPQHYPRRRPRGILEEFDVPTATASPREKSTRRAWRADRRETVRNPDFSAQPERISATRSGFPADGRRRFGTATHSGPRLCCNGDSHIPHPPGRAERKEPVHSFHLPGGCSGAGGGTVSRRTSTRSWCRRESLPSARAGVGHACCPCRTPHPISNPLA